MKITRSAAGTGLAAVLATAALVGGAPGTARAASGPTAGDPYAVSTNGTDTVIWLDLRTGATGVFAAATSADEPAVSPDGTKVAYGDLDTGDLKVLDVASGATSTLVTGTQTDTTYTDQRTPAWSPSGTTVAFVTEDGDEDGVLSSAVETVPATGGEPTTVTDQGDDPTYLGSTLVWTDGSATDCALQAASSCFLSQSAVDTAVGTNGVGVTATGTPGGAAAGLELYVPGTASKPGDAHELATLDVTTKSITLLPITKTAVTDSPSDVYYDLPVVDATGTELFTLKEDDSSAALYSLDLQARDHLAKVSSAVGVGELAVHTIDPASAAASVYRALPTPVRILDTRTTTGGHPGAITATAPFDLTVAGANGIPGNATAAVVNLTGVTPSTGTYLQVFPTPASGTARPTVSNLNLARGQTAANAATVTLGSGGKVRIANAVGSSDVLVDVVGVYVPLASRTSDDATFVPETTPVRVFDTRNATGAPKAAIGPKGYVDLDLSSRIPSNASAVVLNLGGTEGTAPTFVTAYPTSGTTPPTTSTLNLARGETRANLATASVGTDRKVRIYNSAGSTQVFADLVGYDTRSIDGDAYFPVSPTRVLDTRDGTKTVGGVAGAIGATGRQDGQGVGSITTAYGQVYVPLDARALQVNLTAVGATRPTFLSLYATPTTTTETPSFSSLNVISGTPIANAAITAVGNLGQVRVYNSAGTAQALLDLAGWFAPIAD